MIGKILLIKSGLTVIPLNKNDDSYECIIIRDNGNPVNIKEGEIVGALIKITSEEITLGKEVQGLIINTDIFWMPGYKVINEVC